MMKKKTYLSPEVATTVIVVDSHMLETSPTTTITITENPGEGDGSDAASRHYDAWE
jgi:hypothetical protein